MRRRFLALLPVVVLLCGCGGSEQPPELHPVKGKVVKGNQTITAGTVQFQAVESNGLTTLAEIEADGSFTLATLFKGKRYPGAPVGAHRVTVILPPGGDSRSMTPVDLPTVHTVEAGRENVFTLDLNFAKP